MTHFLLFLIATLLVAHTGIAFAGLLQRPGNILDWLPARIERIKNPYVRDLLSCMKCVSGQFALWTFVALSITEGIFHPVYSIFFGIAWICWIIVATDQLAKWEGYG